MKKVAVLLAVLFAAAPVFAGDNGIIKLSLWGNAAVAIPNNIHDVRGVSLGIGSDADSVYGLQWDFIYNNAKEVRGIKEAWFYETADVVWGIEGALVSVNRQEVKGLQVGLVNIAKNGWFPVMVIVNGRF